MHVETKLLLFTSQNKVSERNYKIQSYVNSIQTRETGVRKM